MKKSVKCDYVSLHRHIEIRIYYVCVFMYFLFIHRVKDHKLLINTMYPGEDVEKFNGVDQTWSIASFNSPVTHALKLRTR